MCAAWLCAAADEAGGCEAPERLPEASLPAMGLAWEAPGISGALSV